MGTSSTWKNEYWSALQKRDSKVAKTSCIWQLTLNLSVLSLHSHFRNSHQSTQKSRSPEIQKSTACICQQTWNLSGLSLHSHFRNPHLRNQALYMSLCHQGTHLQIQASGKLIYLSRELGIYLSIETCPALTGLALWAGQVAGYCCPSQPSNGMGEISSWLLLPALSFPNKRWRAQGSPNKR